MKILVTMEFADGVLRPASRSALTFARLIAERESAEVVSLVMGQGMAAAAEEAAVYGAVWVADDASLAVPLAETHAPVVARAVEALGATLVVGATSTWSKDMLGRAAGLMGGAMASDVVGHRWSEDGTLRLDRPVYAGAYLATVELLGQPRVVTVRGSAYAEAAPAATPGAITPVAVEPVRVRTRWEGLSKRPGGRPDATDAAVVVSGGRAIKSGEDFEKLIGGLADRLGGAAGSSRALVDAGITTNDLQIGQTGKVVAPDLYLAVGLSGAIQHLAGMNGSKTVIAINKDAEAPIFRYADYGLVGDVHEVIPALLEKLA